MNLERLAQNLPKWMEASIVFEFVRGRCAWFLVGNKSFYVSDSNDDRTTPAAFELFSQMQKVCGERGWSLGMCADADGVQLWVDDGATRLLVDAGTQPDLVQAIIELASVFHWGVK